MPQVLWVVMLKAHSTGVTPSPSSQTLPVSVHSDQLAVKVLSEPM